ncbi:slipin family protein [Sphingobacterium sp. DK4209]|uniref:Slipin family protein n=1 Tax=Sphingobacterium zhuxiongii TaxID=2662364 RepID=A0A5Q0QEY6_9SPHI|nr:MULTISPECIES: slipin family protein [unclassified Sphingobacterium]MVZ66517.1 slipin family protein [Sphingobacterium sp. DK4209]QGA27829.1 slipin family protein [Sphingobacterium sp. dk4302]
MKRITINGNEIGLLIKDEAPIRVLTTGKHWIGFGKKYEIYDITKPFRSAFEIDLLLQIEGFKERVHPVEVGDSEICIVAMNHNFKEILGPGRYIFWKGIYEYTFQIEDLSAIEISERVSKVWLNFAVFSNYVRRFTVAPSERALMFIDGKFNQILEAGEYTWWKNSTKIDIAKADMRLINLEIIGQEILTKDKAQIRINFSAQYQVLDIIKALLNNKEFEKQLYVLMQLALRSFVGQLTLDELMENKVEIAEHVISSTADQVDLLGVKVMIAGIKDIILPGDIREIMNQVLLAEKRAQANIITRREETASTRSLMNTAKLMEDNAMLFKLKEMEYVEKIAEKINSISVSGNGQIVDQLKQLFVK